MDCPTPEQMQSLFIAAARAPAPADISEVIAGQDMVIEPAPECGEGIVRVRFRANAGDLGDAATQHHGINTFQIDFAGATATGMRTGASTDIAAAPVLVMPNGLRSGPFENGIPNLHGIVRIETYVPAEFAEELRRANAVTVQYMYRR